MLTETSPERQITGIAMCLSCHDGNVAKGAMMANKSFEQAAGMLPAGVYGTQDIPTLLGADGGSYGNYLNDHPVGPDGLFGHPVLPSMPLHGCGRSERKQRDFDRNRLLNGPG